MKYLKPVLISLLWGGLYSFGWISGQYYERQKLLKVGYAEYVIDSKTGEKTYQLKTPENILKDWGIRTLKEKFDE